MSRPHPLLAVMLVVVRGTATHPTVPHLTVVSETVVKEGPVLGSIVIHSGVATYGASYRYWAV